MKICIHVKVEIHEMFAGIKCSHFYLKNGQYYRAQEIKFMAD